jgi:predicted phage terminase large subunit-like protein
MDTRFASPAPFQKLMMREFADVVAGRQRFLALSIPPRHSKTTLGSVLMPAFALGQDDKLEIVLASHSADLAERNSRLSRDLLEQDAWPFAARLAPDSTAVSRWHVKGGGSVRALGVGAGLLGRGASILCVDDALANGDSDVECEAAWQWFHNIASSRLNKGGRIVIIGQRLKEGDLIGRVLESEIGAQFKVVNLPAVCEDEDLPVERELGRHNGEALWPSQFPLDELAVRRQLMGSRSYAAQFLGQPLPSSGDLVRIEYLEHYYEREPDHDDLKIIFGLDSASKLGLQNDNSALCVLGSNKSHHYLLDMIVRKVDYPGLRRMLIAAAEHYDPSAIYAEDSSNATALIQELSAETRLPIVAVQARGTKVSRWEAQTGLLESGRVLMPSERLARGWVDAFLRELLAAPHGRRDDQCDAFFIALAAAARQKPLTLLGGLSFVDNRPSFDVDYRDPRQWRAS